jgi:hypothetical protein
MAGFKEARFRNLQKLSEAYAIASTDIPDLLDAIGFSNVDWSTIRIAPIGHRARVAWEHTWQPNERHHWNWPERLSRYESSSRWFELAVWHGDTLCGLCVGEYPKDRSRLCLHLLEGNPADNHPLKRCVSVIVLHIAEVFCERIGAKQLWLLNPAPEAAHIFEAVFQLAKRPDGMPYLWKEVPR